MYRQAMHQELILNNPKAINEKLQWLKLHDRNTLYTILVDMFAVKQWVAGRIGEEYVTPVYGAWSDVEDINFDKLPEQFVLKTNHDCGGIAICRDKASFDFEKAKMDLGAHLKRNYYWGCREWPYKDVKPCVFAEEYREDFASGELPDYKCFYFDGIAKAMFIATERFGGKETEFDFYDAEFNHLPFLNGHPHSPKDLEKPKEFEKMRELAERLSKGIPHVRVDFYATEAGVYFGEMTFSHWDGLVPFEPPEWDDVFGSWIQLPSGRRLFVSDGFLLRVASHREGSFGKMVDHKFYCFNGTPMFLYISQGLEDHDTARISFLNPDWSFAEFKRDDYRCFESLPLKPESFDQMLDISRDLSVGIPIVRVDLFEVDGQPRFSELTFSPCGGFMRFHPPEWDAKTGKMLDLRGFDASVSFSNSAR